MEGTCEARRRRVKKLLCGGNEEDRKGKKGERKVLNCRMDSLEMTKTRFSL